MAIPEFDHNHVLPPFVGSPASPNDLSPYLCTSLEFCERFALSSYRIGILRKFFDFRSKMHLCGIVTGFQWIDGSFVEDIEQSQGRPPRDLDVVSFVDLNGLDPVQIESAFPEFINSRLSKSGYMLDHYIVEHCVEPELTVESTRYWLQLFTHNRAGHWKGIVRIQLGTISDDSIALSYLNSLKE